MIKKFYETVVAVECDGGCMSEFRPEMDNDESVLELEEVLLQAESMGWQRLIMSDGEALHFCPACMVRQQNLENVPDEIA